MTLSKQALERLQDHWAVGAIGTKDHERSIELTHQLLAHRAVGDQIDFSFKRGRDQEQSDDEFLSRITLAYEIAAIEGLDDLSRPSGGERAGLQQQAQAAAFRAFDIRRVLPLPTETHERLFCVLQLSALAYCGDRWSDLRRWYAENDAALASPSVASAPWDRRLLYRLFDCWIRLFRKSGWDDLDRIREIIAGLREDQKIHEASRLQNDDRAETRAIALRLAALYHWAKGTEILALYMLQGEPASPLGLLDKHFEAAIKAAAASGDAQHEMILRWLFASGRLMVANSLWWTTRAVNSRASQFVGSLAKREHQALYELLPPQRAALLEQGLLDQAKTAIVVDMPTSGGKTLLAQFRILQALNQFDAEGGWVAYVAPTRALSAQISRRLRQDFELIGVRVDQLGAAIDLDVFEEELLDEKDNPFDVLVTTPEKLSLVVRNKKVKRPLALVVMDEAHNIENEGRGLRMELLLATVLRDCKQANLLLLMPYVEDIQSIARWLAQGTGADQSISLGTTPWKPNERIIGLYRAVVDDSVRGGWHLNFETLTTTEKAMKLGGNHRVGAVKPINVSKCNVLGQGRQMGLGTQTAAISSILSKRGTSIAVANNTRVVWDMARKAADALQPLKHPSAAIGLVQDFLRTEIDREFELIGMLDRGVGVHHAGLSGEVRTLMEWLAETGNLKVLCATSTIAQGINFPVASVFLSSISVPQPGRSTPMTPRDFWNLAGRAGRIGHDSVGVVGIAEGSRRDEMISFVNKNTGALVSRLVRMLDDLAEKGELANLSGVLWQNQWDDFRCYINHLWADKQKLDAVLADTEQLLRQTYGYTVLREDPAQSKKADTLLEAARIYATGLANKNLRVIQLADATGFSPEGVSKAIRELGNLEDKLKPSDWSPESLFGSGGKMADLFGVMLQVPQLKHELRELAGAGIDRKRLSEITRDWVNGKKLSEIAARYFSDEKQTSTDALTDACRAIYRSIVNNGTWGMSALSRFSGIDFESLSASERRKINLIPAMIYHGVSSEDAVLMRMNAAPRSAAESLGSLFQEQYAGDDSRYSISKARQFLKDLGDDGWNKACPKGSSLTGQGYKRVWGVLSGEVPG